MLKITLSKVCSYLYKSDYKNPVRAEIYKVIDKNPHPKTEISHEFRPEVKETIERVIKILEAEEKKREQELRKLKRKK